MQSLKFIDGSQKHVFPAIFQHLFVTYLGTNITEKERLLHSPVRPSVIGRGCQMTSVIATPPVILIGRSKVWVHPLVGLKLTICTCDGIIVFHFIPR